MLYWYLSVCFLPIDRMNFDAWLTREVLEATSVAEDIILHASAPYFFPEGFNNESLVRSYLDGIRLFPSGLHIEIFTTFD